VPGADPVRLSDLAVEFHGADWALGQATLVPLPLAAGTDGPPLVACRWRSAGTDRIGVLDGRTGRLHRVEQPAVTISALCAHGSEVAWLGSTPFEGPAVWAADLGSADVGSADLGAADGGAQGASVPCRLAVGAPGRAVDPADVSVGAPFSFENRHGQQVDGLYFAPVLSGVAGPASERPPLIVHCHGGPTGAAEAGFDIVVQYFTTRGFGVAAVDYGGSTGHGRPYRDRLRGSWGVLDVEDCADAAAYLAAQSTVDGRRLAIRGGSAGGLTALGALARSDRFAAAATWSGVTDLRGLAASTHDFEAHYMDWLVGPLPEAGDEYDRRSPRLAVDRMQGSVLLLQGTEDPVVPLTQAETMAAALRAKGGDCRLLTFAGEGHGFRRAATIEACLQAEHRFYLDVLVTGEDRSPPGGIAGQ
jgi:dipeptidyl aminopeptidase/acylaminoacyl peptidase